MPSSSPLGAFSRKVELETRNRSLRRPDFLGRNGGSMKEMVVLAVNWRWPPSFRSLNKYTTGRVHSISKDSVLMATGPVPPSSASSCTYIGGDDGADHSPCLTTPTTPP